MIKYFYILIGIVISACTTNTKKNQDQKKPNVLMIVLDDQNDLAGTLKESAVQTPSIDKLATRSTLFAHAYCSAPACGPSRSSFLTGILPPTSGVYYNAQPNESDPREWLKNAVNLPLHFKNQGYLTGIYGKIFHAKDKGDRISQFATPGYFSEHTGFWANIPDSSVVKLTDLRYEGGSNFAWGAVPDQWENEEHQLIDTENTNKVIEVLKQEHDRPFFISLGILRPHLPWIAPQRFFDLYPLENMELPGGYKASDLSDLPEPAKWMAREVPGADIGESNVHDAVLKENVWKEAIQAYYASSSYADHQVGRVMDALAESQYAENTIIIFLSDHGYHLGEKEHWTKFGLWEKSNHIPLMISLPGQHDAQQALSPVSSIDLYPTLVSLTGIDLPETHQLEGVDLSAILENPEKSRGKPVVSTYGYQNHGIRDERYRYIRYRNGDEELYDHQSDPYEIDNLANDSNFAEIKQKLKKELPQVNMPEPEKGGGNLGWEEKVFEKGYQYQENKKNL